MGLIIKEPPSQGFSQAFSQGNLTCSTPLPEATKLHPFDPMRPIRTKPMLLAHPERMDIPRFHPYGRKGGSGLCPPPKFHIYCSPWKMVGRQALLSYIGWVLVTFQERTVKLRKRYSWYVWDGMPIGWWHNLCIMLAYDTKAKEWRTTFSIFSHVALDWFGYIFNLSKKNKCPLWRLVCQPVHPASYRSKLILLDNGKNSGEHFGIGIFNSHGRPQTRTPAVLGTLKKPLLFEKMQKSGRSRSSATISFSPKSYEFGFFYQKTWIFDTHHLTMSSLKTPGPQVQNLWQPHLLKPPKVQDWRIIAEQRAIHHHLHQLISSLASPWVSLHHVKPFVNPRHPVIPPEV